MALTFEATDQAWVEILKGDLVLDTDAVTAILVTNTHTPDATTQDEYSDVSANECADADYSQQQVANMAVTLVSRRARFDHDLVVFTADAAGGVGDVAGRYVYYVAGTAGALNATDRLIGYVDLTGDGNATAINAVFSFNPADSGIFEVARPAAA